MKKKHLLPILLVLAIAGWQQTDAQQPERLDAAEIYQAIEKLNVLGSALYVAAHPDDENTRMIAWLENEKHLHTAYLSLTRGDGGQNLVGPEISALLGLIRTQELLAARRIDGGNQLFTRANDFGFSKHPDETLKIWNKDEVLADVVWAIRKWQPDVIINRFDHATPGRTHGHHTASAMLSYEAFDLAGDTSAYPGQLGLVSAWQPHRLFFNTSWWFYGSQEAFEKADKSDMTGVDGGVYYPLLGKSNGEIAAESRSMHKSQGFGSVGNRGEQMEYIKLLKGEPIRSMDDPFAGINTTWTRVEGGAPIGEVLSAVRAEYRHDRPEASIPKLMEAYRMVRELPDGFWKRVKSAELERVITACMGLFAEAVASDESAAPGEAVELTLEVINRSQVPCTLRSVSILPMGTDTVLQLALAPNRDHTWKQQVNLPADIPLTNAYWLNEPMSGIGMYRVDDPALRGLPETPRTFRVRFELSVDGHPMVLERAVVYKRDDDVKGEVYQPFEIIPPVFVDLTKDVFLFPDLEPQPVDVLVKAGKAGVSGQLRLGHTGRWSAVPEYVDFNLSAKGEEQTFTFTLYPTEKATVGKVAPLASVGQVPYFRKSVKIAYDHIPTQLVLLNAEAKIARVDLRRGVDRIAYIMGAGDDVPESLRQVGYTVDILAPEDVTAEVLASYEALVLGVRAYNTLERLKYLQPVLFEYVRKGGTMVVQYNTTGSLNTPAEGLAPYPMKLSRDRVTVEDAEVRFLAPDHRVLHHPNEITAADFDGWVQERGLYFPQEWDAAFTPILSCNDPGEPARDGSLLVAPYGAGHYVYTSLSFFRELPAGVTGAYRLFANLLSIGKQ